jgi:hypothetical protein
VVYWFSKLCFHKRVNLCRRYLEVCAFFQQEIELYRDEAEARGGADLSDRSAGTPYKSTNPVAP